MIYILENLLSAENVFLFEKVRSGGFNLMIYHPSRSAEISVFVLKSRIL